MSYLEALQETLAAEHAAVYVIGVLGAQTSQNQSPGLYETLTESYAEHRAARDRLVGLVIGAGGEPVVAETAYALPDDLSRSDVLERRALEVQRTLATSYAALTASSTGSDRRWPIARLQATAVRELALGGAAQLFPGSDEYPDR
ncbi:ferritin-like domain-containing protein [Nocardioides salsibiostraticola]